MESYKTLEKVFKKLNDIGQAQSILHWDMAVGMPQGGAYARGDQLATLKSISHAILTDEGIGELIEDAKSQNKKLGDWEKANLREMESSWRHANAVSQKLVSQLAIEGTKCEMAWREAREKKDFSIYAPHLKKVLKIVREIAKEKASVFGCTLYEALLDSYDPGRKEKQLDEVFDNLKGFLPEFIGQVVEKQKAGKEPKSLEGKYSKEDQKELANKMLETIGFNFEYGRFDESLHPFCGGYPSDIRITTRYDEKDFTSSLMGVLHEGGHAMYEAGLPRKWNSQPVGHARGMSVHESQSLLVEMQICRSKEFLKYMLPIAKKQFGGKGKAWELSNVVALYNKVEPSLIRVDADEVTYPAHIIVRYYIEKFLIDGEMEVSDLPDAWEQGMNKFLGVKPGNDSEGCMQDIHWTDGSFGYFPTYTLGAIYAAQIFAKMKEDIDGLDKHIEKGEFEPVKSWLFGNLHRYGSKYDTDKLINKATGSDLDVEIYKKHLQDRYLGK